jgi:glycine dehydrogenase subunit 1
MHYIPVSATEREKMLTRVGVTTTAELFADVPRAAMLDRELALREGLSEIDLAAALATLASENRDATQYVCFAGGGIYDHYRPAFIDHLLLRPEFFTAYTPYQPEVSQGTLQAIYEYQTGMCELTGLDVANASMYDGATALVEAAFMALRLSRKRRKVLVSETLHPEKLETLAPYAASGLFELCLVPADGHVTDAAAYNSLLDETVAAVLLPYPNYYGIIEDCVPLIETAHAAGALVVLDTNPLLLSLLRRPGELGADIAVGEGQALGNAMSFGGPGLGYFACRQSCVRQMPGRLVGRTVDVDGADGYVLTLATREQHIRRERATSNICSNHALNALAAGMYLAAAGTDGLRAIAADCCAKARYLHDRLLDSGLFVRYGETPEPGSGPPPFGYEFALRYTGRTSVQDLHDSLFACGWLAGIPLPDKAGLLFAVTERRTVAEIDNFVKEVRAHG